jgi:hypothetical protein
MFNSNEVNCRVVFENHIESTRTKQRRNKLKKKVVVRGRIEGWMGRE